MPKSASATISTSLLGAAAEHYVMCQLLRRGKLAALAPLGMPFADIIVSESVGRAVAAVQVKARTYGSDGGWHMSAKHEAVDQPLVFYCLVDFGTDIAAPPRCWVVPSGIVARALKKSYQAWLSKPGQGGKPHNEHDMRRLRPNYIDLGLEEYPQGWLDLYEREEAWTAVAAS